MASLTSLPDLDHVLDHATDVANDPDVDRHDLVDRTAIDIDMDLARLGSEGIKLARDAIVEACAEADNQVPLVHRPIRFIGAVHA